MLATAQTTRFEYDGFNRVKKVVYPGGGEEQFTYDVVGRLKTRTDRKGVVTTYTYDDAGHLLGRSHSDGVTPAVSFTYDALGRMLTAANGTDTLTWSYDLAGQLLSELSTKNASTVAYTYDAGGNRLNISLGGTVFLTYAYDDASRLTTITRGSNAFTFGYDDSNRRTSMSYPNGVTTSYAYDTLSRLTSLGASLGGSAVTSFAYAYDDAGNRTSKTTPDVTESYAYDELYRLTEVGRTGSQTDETFYRYDTVGNRLSKQAGQAVVSSLYDAANRLVSSSGGGPLRIRGHLNEPGTATVNGQVARILAGTVFDATISSTPGTNTVAVAATDLSGNVTTSSWTVNVAANASGYAYDSNGNLTQRIEGNDTWTYEWDAENRLKRVLKNAAEVARLAYDPLGRRVEKVAAATTTSWAYDGEDILREVSGATTLKYVHGPGIDEPLAQEDGAGALSFFQADGLGSIVKMTGSAGAVTGSKQYDAFGNLEFGATNGYAFTGREWDAETALAYYRARYYDPKIGRFLSEDPVNFLSGPNFYRYARNNPVNRVDPSGLKEYQNNFIGPMRPSDYYTWQMTKTICGLIPPLPPGTNIRRNMLEAGSHVDPWWYRRHVKTPPSKPPAPWDYKKIDPRYTDGGNFNFGATCRAFGFPEKVCLREAGRGQIEAGTSQPNWGNPGPKYNLTPWGGTPPYGDDAEDQAWIQRGMDACVCILSHP